MSAILTAPPSSVAYGTPGYGTNIWSVAPLNLLLLPSSVTYDGSNNVTAWNNLGILGGAFIQDADAAKRPVYNASGGPNGLASVDHNGAYSSFMYANSAALNGILRKKTSCTVLALFKTSGTQTQGIFFTSTNASDSQSRLACYMQPSGFGNGTLTTRNVDAGNDALGARSYGTGINAYTDNTWGVAAWICEWDKQRITILYNGQILCSTWLWNGSASITSDTDSMTVRIMSSGGTGPYDVFRGSLSAVMEYDRALTHRELTVPMDYLANLGATPKLWNGMRYFVLGDGDSMIQMLTYPYANIMNASIAAQTTPSAIGFYNSGISGQAIQTIESGITITTGYSNLVLPYGINRSDVILYDQMGTNNLYGGSGESAATVYGRYVSYMTTQRGLGFTGPRVFGSQLPRVDAAGWAQMQAYNSYVADRYDVLSDTYNLWGVVDCTKNAAFNDGSDPADLTNYQADTIHLNEVGGPKHAALYEAQLKQIILRKQMEETYRSRIKVQLIAGKGLTLASGKVARWANAWSLTGSKYDFVQTNVSKQPTFVTNQRYLMPVVRFDGGDDVLVMATNAGLDLVQNVKSVFIGAIFKSTSTTTSQDIFYAGTSTTSARFAFSLNSSNKALCTTRDGSDSNASGVTGSTNVGTNFGVWTSYYDVQGTDVIIYKDGSFYANNLSYPSTPSNTADTPSFGISIGANGTGTGSFLAGDLLELWVFTDLTTAEITALRSTFAQYGAAKAM